MFPLISSQDHSVSSKQSCGCCAGQAASWHRQNTKPRAPTLQTALEPGAQADVLSAAQAMLDIPCLLEFWSKDVFIEMLSTVVHFLSRDCGSLILLISRFTFKFEFIPESTHSLWDTGWTSAAHPAVPESTEEHITMVMSCFQGSASEEHSST